MKFNFWRYPRQICLLLIACGYVCFVGFETLFQDGITGATKKNGFGCICHRPNPSDSVTVWINGPDSVRTGSKNLYTICITGGPAIAGGFNVAADSGMLSPFDTTAQLEFGELTHVAPKPFQNDTVMWKFYYQAPAIGTVDTLYSAGNSVNNNGVPDTGDHWNFGANFPVHVVPDSTTAVVERDFPHGFILYQNYPNPFNPTTIIGFRIASTGYVTMKIFDISGREIATLISGIMLPGYHQVSWDATGFASGILFCRLTAGKYNQIRKIILVR